MPVVDRRLAIALFIFGVLLGATFGIAYGRYSATYVQTPASTYDVHFSPNGGCADAVIYWISRANQSIHVLIYIFTLQNIAEALISAHGRGIEVKVVFDKSQVAGSAQYGLLKASGIDVRYDTNPNGILHDKIAIIDDRVVLTGSFNWTGSAENSNNENLIVVRSPDVASKYEVQFQRIWSHSQG